VNRGEVWWAELTEPIKSEPGYKRPVVIIQNDAFNISKINTIICIIITTNLILSEAPGNILLPSRSTGLLKDSVLNISQIITIDKSMLVEKIGKLTNKQLNKVNESLKIALDIK
jgi:mRNA interferase MazF